MTFHNADTGFAVLKVKARGRRDLVALVGHAPTIGAGEYIHAVGTWFTDRTHGLQLKAAEDHAADDGRRHRTHLG